MTALLVPRIRDARLEDADAVRALYAHEVENGFANYEYMPPDLEEMRRRMTAIRESGHPWLIAEIDGDFAGYAYASPFRSRAGYRWTVENTVYVRPDRHRRGIGKALLEALIERCTALGHRQMIAVIGDATNAASIALHHAMGFEHVGTFRGIGWKAVDDGPGRWLDNVQMQRPLGQGDTAPPSPIPSTRE
ncbi:MAG: GNAT family N-acetyltransferase [Pseudomonadota bacterium]